MAQVNYNQGVSDVAPSNEGIPYQSGAGATPEAFGAGIGHGLESLGAGASTAGKFFGKVVADDASNQYQDFATKLLHGDSSKMVAGPDGTQQPDTGYLGLKGRAALDHRPVIEKQLKDEAERIRGGLQSPEQVQEFENFSRRYRVGATEKIGSHADSQASTWYTSVNIASAKLAMDHIANNPDNPKEVAAGAADLTAAYVKTAQVNGATPDSPQFKEAMAAARRDGLQAQLNAIAVKDPARALAILDKPENRAVAGVMYDNLANSFRTRKEAQRGDVAAENALKGTYAIHPDAAVERVKLEGVGAPYGVSGAYLLRTRQIENGNFDTRENSAHAQGPFQFIPSTAAQYGLKPEDRNDYDKSADAAARLAAANKTALESHLGRAPTDPELYLAHQQGAGGAAKLLANPTARAGDLVGDAAIRQNGGDPNAPAAAFTGMWTAKFNGAAGAAIASRKALATDAVLADPTLNDTERQHALSRINQQLAAQAVAQEQDAKARKAASDQLQGQITSDIIKGAGPEIIEKIAAAANSGQLSGSEARELYNFATSKGGIEDTMANGPGYVDAMHRILLPPDNPAKIYDAEQIIRMRNDGTLTRKGASDLITTMAQIKKDPDAAGVATTRASQLKYYLSQMGIDSGMPNTPGIEPYKNKIGVDKFNHEFVPAVESAYNEWAKKGGNAMEFWNDRKKLDGIMDSVYPPSQRKADSLFANNGGAAPPVEKGPAPPPPADADPKAWSRLVADPPKGWEAKRWGDAIQSLHADPTPEKIAAFDYWLEASGYKAQDVLKVYGGAVPKGPEPVKTKPDEPGILSKAVENVLHYGRTGRAPGEGYSGEEIVPGATAHIGADIPADTNPVLSKLVRSNAIPPDAGPKIDDKSLHHPPGVPVTAMGQRG